MKMASSAIIDLLPIFRRRDLPPDVNCDVGRLKFSRYGASNLASSDRSRIFSHGCRDDVCSRNICPGCYVLDNGDLYSRFPGDVDQAVQLLFTGIPVLVLLPMVFDQFNVCARARALQLKLKLW
jgi:hypothetical protein